MDKRDMHIYLGQAYNLAYNNATDRTVIEDIEREAMRIFKSLIRLHTVLNNNIKDQ